VLGKMINELLDGSSATGDLSSDHAASPDESREIPIARVIIQRL
jgi:hypothetical protein